MSDRRALPRRITFALRAVAATVLVGVTACAPRYDEIDREAKLLSIQVACRNGLDCDRDSGPFGFQYEVLHADGSVVAGRSAFSLEPPIRRPRSEFRALVDQLVRTTPFLFAAAPTTATYHSGETSWIVTLVLRNGSSRSVAVPEPERDVPRSTGEQLLARWVLAAEQSVAKPLQIARARRIARIGDLGALTSVEYDANGCYGFCPAYAARFDATGDATLTSRAPFASTAVHRARVPFDRVGDLLETSRFAQLERRYPVRAEDTFGASLVLRYRDGSTDRVDAPDEMAWPASFRELSARMDQLVLDTVWRPPLRPRPGSLDGPPPYARGTPPAVPHALLGTWSSGACASPAKRLTVAPHAIAIGGDRPMAVDYEPRGGYRDVGSATPVVRWQGTDERAIFWYDAARRRIVEHPDPEAALPDVSFARCDR